MGVLGEVEGMIGTAQGTLEVAQEGVDRAQLRQSDATLASTCDHTLVLGTETLDGTEAPQPVGDHGGRRCDRAGGEDRHLLTGEGLLAQAHELRLALGRGLDGDDEGDLVLRAAPDLASRALAPEVGVVDLHPALELARVLALAHHLHELVLHEPGGLVANPQVALEFKRGDVVLGLGQQVHRQEPARQRQLGRLKDRAADDAALVPAGGALEVQPPLASERAAVAAPARRTGKALGSARVDQRRLATRFTAVPIHEFGHRKPGLKLHSVHRHRSPPVSVNLFFAPSGSLDETAELCH